MEEIFHVQYDNIDEKDLCGHCGEGGLDFTLYKDEIKGLYHLKERFICLTFDEERFIWSGQSIENLINSIITKPNEYNIPTKSFGDFMGKLRELQITKQQDFKDL